ncbi:MAG: hypothetical protein WBW41_19475 [Verrucomicrobiia bacterium]
MPLPIPPPCKESLLAKPKGAWWEIGLRPCARLSSAVGATYL